MRQVIMTIFAVTASALSTTATHADLGDLLFKLLADDGAADHHFGHSVSISGDTIIVGALLDDDNGDGSGAAYLFDAEAGRQLHKLRAEDGGQWDHFGKSVAISATTAIVGAWWDDDNGEDSGAAYLFDTTTGKQLFKLLAEDGAPDDGFGLSVAIDGATAIVGAYSDNEATGAAYLFDTTTGTQLHKLVSEDAAVGDHVGAAVAISGDIAFVGAWGDDDNGENSGAAYLFDIATGSQLVKLLPDDGAAYDWFGRSVAISGFTAIVGAERDDDNGGSAYLFDTTTGQQLHKLLSDRGAAGDRFGHSVAIDGTLAIVGAKFASFSGSAYLFDTTTGQQLFQFLPDDSGAEEDIFGRSVSISGNVAVVGAKFDGDNGDHAGAAYVYSVAICAADLDDDSNVGPADLAIILGNWGPVPPNDPVADLNDDGVVDPADLAIVLGNWGPCP